MIRRLIAAVVIVLAGGLVVAMVPAQEAAQQSVLARPPFRAVVDERVGSGLARSASAEETSGEQVGAGDAGSARPRLVDRLQKIRRNVVGDGIAPPSESELPQGTGTISGPVALDPAKQQPASSAAPNQQEPKLLDGDGAAPADEGEMAPAGVPSVLRRGPAPVTEIDDAASARRPRELRQSVDLSPPASIPARESAADAALPSAPAEPASAPDEPAISAPKSELVEAPVERTASRTPQASNTAASRGELLSTIGPALRIDASGPEAILIGREADYELRLTNQSSIPASDVYVRLVVPTWIDIVAANASLGTTQVRGGELGGQHLIWSANQLAAGGSELLKLKVIPRENRPFHLAVDWTQRPAASVAEIVVQQPQLEMAVFGPREIQYGETAVYTIQLANPGTGPADGVEVDFSYGSEKLPTKQIGSLAAGEQTEIRVELTARQAGALQVAAAAMAAGGLRSKAMADVLVRRAKLEVEVVGVPVKFAGSVATYEIRIRNVGDAAATEVESHLNLPQGAKYVTQEPANELKGNTVVRQLGTIAPGSERTFRVACELTTAGDNLLEVRTTGRSELSASGSFITQVKALADLKLVVNDPQGPTPVGADAVYELTIVNRGTKAARDVRIIAQFSEGVEPVEAAGSTARTVPGQVIFQPINRIEPDEQVKLRVVARADREGNHRFRAELKCSEPDTVLVAEESTYFFGDDLATARTQEAGRR